MEDNEKPIGTLDILQQLDGDTFPVNEGVLLDENAKKNIKTFFYALFKSMGLKRADVIRTANLPRNYAYQIISGERIGKRDYYLNLAIAMGLDLDTTQRMLAVTNHGTLYARIKRDAAVIFAIKHHYTCEQTYDLMCSEKVAVKPLDTGVE